MTYLLAAADVNFTRPDCVRTHHHRSPELDRRLAELETRPMNDEDRDLSAEELADPATRMRIEAMKVLVRVLVEEAGDRGISVGELKRRLGITSEPNHRHDEPRRSGLRTRPHRG